MGKSQSKSIELKEKVRKLENDRSVRIQSQNHPKTPKQHQQAPPPPTESDDRTNELRDALVRLVATLRLEGNLDEARATMQKLIEISSLDLEEKAGFLLRLAGLERAKSVASGGDASDRRTALESSARLATESLEIRSVILRDNPNSIKAKEAVAYAKGFLATVLLLLEDKADQSRALASDALELFAQCPLAVDPSRRVLEQGVWKPPFSRPNVKPPKRVVSVDANTAATAAAAETLKLAQQQPATYRLVLVKSASPAAPVGDVALTAKAHEQIYLFDDESFIELGGSRKSNAGKLAIGHTFSSVFHSPVSTKEIAAYHALARKAPPPSGSSSSDEVRWTIFDPNNSGGTGVRINGTRITRSLLKPGDVLQLGGAKHVKIGEYDPTGGKGLTYVVEKASSPAVATGEARGKKSSTSITVEGDGLARFQKLLIAAYAQLKLSKPSGLATRDAYHRVVVVDGVPPHAWATWCAGQAVAAAFQQI